MSSFGRVIGLFLFRAASVRAVVAGCVFVVVFGLVPVRALGVLDVNTAQFDIGYCGHLVTQGLDLSAISSSTPWFDFEGDGGGSTYRLTIDGVSVGDFTADSHSIICVGAPVWLMVFMS